MVLFFRQVSAKKEKEKMDRFSYRSNIFLNTLGLLISLGASAGEDKFLFLCEEAAQLCSRSARLRILKAK